MIKLTSSSLQAQGVYKGRIENMVGGEEKSGCSNSSKSSSSSSGNNSLSVLRTATPTASSVSPASPLSQPKIRGGGRPTTKMELDSGFSSRSPTPGNTEWKEGQIIPGGDGAKNSSSEGIHKRGGLVASSMGEGRTKNNLQNGVEVKDKEGTEKMENQKYQNQNGDCKSSSSYDNSRSYYDEGYSYSNHSSEPGQYKKYYNQQYGYNGYNHNQHQRRYNNNNNNNYRNNGNRNSKNWSKGGPGSSGSRSPNSGNGEWKDNSDCNGSSSSDVTLVNEEESLVSLVECHNKLAIDAPGESKTGDGSNDKNHGSEDKDDSRQYRQSNNNHSSGVGQYKRQSNQQYGNGYAYIRRYNYNSYNNNNNNYRNYGNNRRQFQNQNDYYHHQNHHNYYSNHQNGYYHRDGSNRGYSMHNSPFYNNYRRENGQELPSPDYEDSFPWPAKRGNWHNHHNANLSFSSNDKEYSSPTSRQCSPATSPSSTTDSVASSSFVPSQNCEVSGIMINGNIINAQHLGPYDYICGNMSGQQAASSYYPGYPTNYYYNYPRTSTGHDSRSTRPVVPQTLGLLVTPDSNAESRQGDKTLEWPDEFSDETDSESVATSLSTRCHSPESPGDDFENLPILTNDSSTRLYDESSPSSKESISPNGSVCFRPVRRMSIPQIRFPPEWFEDFDPNDVVKQFSLAGEVKDKPRNLIQGSPFDSLSEAIWSKFVLNQQTTETFKKKVELWRDAYRVVRILNFAPDFKHDPRNFQTFGLQVVGSTMSGFGSNTSDVDMCLIIRASEVDQRFEAVDKLQTLCRTLKVLPCVENQELIYAKVPILKFRDANRRLEVDLNCNNFVGIRNTHLLYSYAQMDWRLKPLVLNVKLWAQYHRINDAKNMTISSYSLVLMVIHFLQYGVDEPVLPVLHKMYPEKFNNSVNILAVSIHEIMPAWESRNTQSLAELLIQFFEYFGRKFDYTRNAISVRLGGTVTLKGAASYRSSKNDPHQWKYLCVEEPFDRTNTARSVYDHDIFQKILGIFYASWQRLLVSRNLESIFTAISDEDARAIAMRVR